MVWTTKSVQNKAFAFSITSAVFSDWKQYAIHTRLRILSFSRRWWVRAHFVSTKLTKQPPGNLGFADLRLFKFLIWLCKFWFKFLNNLATVMYRCNPGPLNITAGRGYRCNKTSTWGGSKPPSRWNGLKISNPEMQKKHCFSAWY